MILYFLPSKLLKLLQDFKFEFLTEIRFRVGFAFSVVYHGQRFFLDKNVICEDRDINYVVSTVTENSIYAFNENIKNGFLTTQNGVRIGLGGECVFDNGKIVTIKKFTSLNIRIPHVIENCSAEYIKYIMNGGQDVYNSLIVSPPFCGKTTILKDIAIKLNKTFNKQLLIIDERGEFEEIVGENIDKVKYCNKSFAFNYALRSLSPEIVITDELCEKNDFDCVINAVNSGLKIIASCHAGCLEEIKNKAFFDEGIFQRYFIVDENIMGRLKYCYNENFEVLNV